MPFRIVQGDITEMKTDAIVNAANSCLAMGGGVCGAIFSAAGPAKLKKACDAIGRCSTGQAVITEGFDLPAKYVVHAVGPVWQGGGFGEKELLSSAYQNALALVKEKRCGSIAFPLISSGIYGYPVEEALETAVSAIKEFLRREEMEIYLVIFDRHTMELCTRLYPENI
ncbi:MAG: macro domain-containing protein [Ruminococcus sp.]